MSLNVYLLPLESGMYQSSFVGARRLSGRQSNLTVQPDGVASITVFFLLL